MFNEFEVTIETVKKNEAVLLTEKGLEFTYPLALLPSKVKEGSKIYFSLSREKFSRATELLNNLLLGKEED